MVTLSDQNYLSWEFSGWEFLAWKFSSWKFFSWTLSRWKLSGLDVMCIIELFFKGDLYGYLQNDAGAKRKVILMLIGSLDIVNVICAQINKCSSTEI